MDINKIKEWVKQRRNQLNHAAENADNYTRQFLGGKIDGIREMLVYLEDHPQEPCHWCKRSP